MGNQDSTKLFVGGMKGITTKDKTRKQRKIHEMGNTELTNKSKDKGTFTDTHIKLKQPKEKEVEERP